MTTKIVNRFLGCDVGKVNDNTALVLVEQVIGCMDDEGNESYLDIDQFEYDVSHLERLRLGTPYPKQVEIIAKRKNRIEDCTLVVDCTGVGTPVLDMLKAAGLDPVGIWITGGEQVNHDENDETRYRVPKRDLVTAVQVIQQQHRLHVAESPEKARLVKELQDFKIKLSAAGHDTFGAWREGQHDDLVLGLAVAVWLAAYRPTKPSKYSGCLTIFGGSFTHYDDEEKGSIPPSQRTGNYRREPWR
jgi:hypothetical protein